MSIIPENIKFIETFLNKTVVHFSRADFMLDDKENMEHFGPLQIKFQDNSVLTLEDNGDAESISISATPIQLGDTNTTNEYWKEIVLDNKPNWSDFINTKLVKVSILQNTFENRTWLCGCQLNFDNDKSLTYFNYFDDAKVSFQVDKLLSSFIESENLKWSK